jgi:PPM family protein phosphatase
MKFSVHQASLIGDRKYNQDRVAFAYSQHAVLLVLADGMGGHSHGELAAMIAIETYLELFTQHDNQIFAEPQAFLTQTMQAAHQRIMQLPHDKDVGFPGTTCVAALIQDGVLYSAYAGDSRLYVLREQAVIHKTRDHSMVQQWVDWGVISEEEGRVHPRRNQITNCLGGIEEMFYAESCPAITLNSADRVLLCSDGLWGAFEDAELSTALLSASDSELNNLMLNAYQRENGHSDNITAIALAWGEPQDDKTTEHVVSAALDIA